MRDRGILDLHQQLLERPGHDLRVQLDDAVQHLDPADRISTAHAAFAVKSYLDMGRPETARLILNRLGEATAASRDRHLLQLAYATAVFGFETSRSPAVVREVLSSVAGRCKAARLPLAAEMAVAIAVLWRLGLIELHFRNRSDSRTYLNRATLMARELGDPNMLGVAYAALGWCYAVQKEWSSARANFLRGLYQVAYEGAPRRLWSDLALGIAWLEIHAPSPNRLGIINVQKLLDTCHRALGGATAYPAYMRGRGHIDPRQLSDTLWRRGIVHRPHSRHIPRWARESLEVSQAKGCSYCGARAELAIDHVFFYSWGGTAGSKELLNLRWLCSRCNSARSDSFGEDDDAFNRLAALRSA